MDKKFPWFGVGLVFGVLFCCAVGGFGLALYRNRAQVKTLVKAQYWKYLVDRGNKQIGSTVSDKDIDEYPEKPITISVDYSKEITKISPLLYGSNLSPQIETEADVIEFAKDTGVTCFRYPGGGSPGYHWKKGAFDYEGRYVNVPLRDLSNVLDFCKKTNAKLVIQVNVESGTAQEAADWVTYMNKTVKFPVAYWELGNEVYSGEDRGHMSGDTYAKVIKEYAIAMKKADPNIKIGVDWATSRKNFFNTAVVKNAGKYIDFVSYHWYPNQTSSQYMFDKRIHPTPKEVMANYLEIPLLVERIKNTFNRYVPGKKVEIGILEWDGAWDGPSWDCAPFSQGILQWSLADALFFADSLGMFASQGISVATQHTFQALGFGMIRGWDKNADGYGSRWDGKTIRPKALAQKLYSRYFGDILLETQVENPPSYYKKADWWPDSYTGRVPYISAYASKFSNKKTTALIIINKHADKEYKVKIELSSMRPKKEGTLYVLTGPELISENEGTLGNVKIEEYKMLDIQKEFMYTVPPRSVNLIEVQQEE